MGRKKRSAARSSAPPAAVGSESPAPVDGSVVAPQKAAGYTPVLLLAALMFLAPALGVPNEEMLQDTLKSMIVSFGAVAAALVFFWQQRRRLDPLRWHVVMWLPLGLVAYALGSMGWSHTY